MKNTKPEAENRLRMVFNLRQAGIKNDSVLRAMEITDRTDFLENRFRVQAHEDLPLPITHGQTISSPSIVAKMTQALDLSHKHKVLEIGTGSGYQTAILSRLARRVYSIERHSDMAFATRARLAKLGYGNVTVIAADGSLGIPEQAPFDRIIVTAAAEDPPSSLLAQLRVDGIMVLPVGQSDAMQTLIKAHKTPTGIEYEELGQVRFVPLLDGRT